MTAPGVYRLIISPVRGTVLAVDRGAVTVGGGDGATDVESGHAVALTGQDTLEVSIDSSIGRRLRPVERRPGSWSGRVEIGSIRGPVHPGLFGSRRRRGVATRSWIRAGLVSDVQVAEVWAPYRYGRWVWVEPWGWTWVESEPWGYAPFHYGRWVNVGRRWGWVPGPVVRHPCYAPALVVFVGVNSGPRGGVQALVPLGPREAYNPWYHADDRYRHRVNVDIDVTVVNYDRTRYANRDRGFTAVSSETFRAGYRHAADGDGDEHAGDVGPRDLASSGHAHHRRHARPPIYSRLRRQ